MYTKQLPCVSNKLRLGTQKVTLPRGLWPFHFCCNARGGSYSHRSVAWAAHDTVPMCCTHQLPLLGETHKRTRCNSVGLKLGHGQEVVIVASDNIRPANMRLLGQGVGATRIEHRHRHRRKQRAAIVTGASTTQLGILKPNSATKNYENTEKKRST